MSLYEKITLAQIPSGYKASTLYSVIPANGDGDFDFTRSSTATRVNKDGIIETVDENVPRLDYPLINGVVQECPSLLLEPQRTNTFLNSEPTTDEGTTGGVTYESYNWQNGLSNAVRFTYGATSYRYGATATASTVTVVSFFVKMDDLSEPSIGGNVINDFALLIAGVVPTNNQKEHVGNNIWRVWGTLTTGTTGLTNNGVLKYSFQTTKGFVCTGFQLESGSYPTSYIPTTGSAVTRLADVSKKENFADMPTDYPFTVYSNNKVDLINSNQWAWSILDVSSAVKYLGLAFANSGYVQLHRRNLNNDIDSITTTVTQGQDFKFAITFLSDTSYRYSINGSATVTVTGGAIVDFDFNDILIGQQRVVSDTGYRNTSNDFRILNENVTSSELTELTS